MSDLELPSDDELNLENNEIKEIEKHYQRIIEHHISRAKLPMVYGWTSKVMMSLIWRLGKSKLEIGLISEEFDMPTRTLQNHLSQEGTNFTYLRDQVRQHYAIQLLIDGKKVEDMYPMLDFSDRTGLINAFKRWTGLPPHHFRKLYNIYVRKNK
ncbi:MAG: helix-turn-helix domain-containing protein [Agarilytica sp.]